MVQLHLVRGLLVGIGLISLVAAAWHPTAATIVNSTAMPWRFRADSLAPSDYWYQGKAELSRYQLSYNRYRELHPGEAVLIFVTEDFLADRQVKSEGGKTKKSVPILKLNALERFTTGIYDYSLMTSVFAPVALDQYPHALKVTNSNQDWCGQTWVQINQRNQGFQLSSRSYFENEGDEDFNLPLTWLEQELWTRLRLHPRHLPLGTLSVIPSLPYLRLAHREAKAYPATATLQPYAGTAFSGENLQAYTLHFPDLQRTLIIVFTAQFPYRIEGWLDTHPSLFDQALRTTVARRTATELLPYWQKNRTADQPWRDTLGLGWNPK